MQNNNNKINEILPIHLSLHKSKAYISFQLTLVIFWTILGWVEIKRNFVAELYLVLLHVGCSRWWEMKEMLEVYL